MGISGGGGIWIGLLAKADVGRRVNRCEPVACVLPTQRLGFTWPFIVGEELPFSIGRIENGMMEFFVSDRRGFEEVMIANG